MTRAESLAAVWRRVADLLSYEARDLDPAAVDKVRRVAERLSRLKIDRPKRRSP